MNKGIPVCHHNYWHKHLTIHEIHIFTYFFKCAFVMTMLLNTPMDCYYMHFLSLCLMSAGL